MLAVVPPMYADMWTGAKAMYKLDPVVADGGRITLLAPAHHDFSVSHGAVLDRIGYHCSDYFGKQWERFSTSHGVYSPTRRTCAAGHVRSREGEQCRIEVVLARGIGRRRCERMGLGWADPATIAPAAFVSVPARWSFHRAGEHLYRLRAPAPLTVRLATDRMDRFPPDHWNSGIRIGLEVAGGLVIQSRDSSTAAV